MQVNNARTKNVTELTEYVAQRHLLQAMYWVIM